MKLPLPASYDLARVEAFIARWRKSGASERANSPLFLSELTDVLGVDRPRPATGDAEKDDYCFERVVAVRHPDGHETPNFIDLYKRGHFILESKQGSEARRAATPIELAAAGGKKSPAKRGTAVRGTGGYDLAMQNAYVQAERYARALPNEWPPFLVVCDVGYSFELYASFDGSGKYQHFPAPGTHRILLERLVEPDVFTLLHAIFTAPLSLDPALESAKVTREIAGHLAILATSLEASGHAPERVAKFLMRCLFTMFAEDVGLLPAANDGRGLFTHFLEDHWLHAPAQFPAEIEGIWERMNAGGTILGVVGRILKFNGGLFSDSSALQLTTEQLKVLLAAARADWSSVEPAIFGTLLERALTPKERHKLGAHFTPRAYVERLVNATIAEPLYDDWAIVRAQVRQLVEADKRADAVKVLREFHRKLVDTRVLDPACGTGNFLYVSLDLFKRLEAEILSDLHDLGQTGLLELETVTVNPGQFLGIEVKPWAREIADLVLWIGYLQWHHRTRGQVNPPEPVLREYRNIECRDALITWERTEPLLDEHGKPVTRWDGETMRLSPVTGEEIPDEHARIAVVRYVGVKRSEWPHADFIVGNPPFVGTRRMRLTMGDGYVEALTVAWPDVAENADLVMYWWHHAALIARAGEVRRFGLITTNSITQSFNRTVVARHLLAKDPLSVVYVIPDHPWTDSADGAAVRVAMTAAQSGVVSGQRLEVASEESVAGEGVRVAFTVAAHGHVSEDLRVGASPAAAGPLEANRGVAFWGVKFYGDGFIVSPAEAAAMHSEDSAHSLIRPFVSGRDLTAAPRGLFAIDCDGLDERELAATHPAAYQRLLERVKPVRAQNPRAFKRDRWWIFGENQPGMRDAVRALRRYIATTETAKHRVFQFLDTTTLAEGTVAVIAIDDALFLGVLSSRIHVVWALAAGGRLGVGNDPRYNKTRCFDPFSFVRANADIEACVREAAELLDAHRKRQQAAHPDLTITGMYNVLEKLRSGEPLSAKDKIIHEQGLVSVLKQLHDELDAAVFDAYGWPHDLTDEQILERLVALNAERAAEEKRGLIRWLRPEYQNPSGKQAATQTTLASEADDAAPVVTSTDRQSWPKEVPGQLTAIRALLSATKDGFTAEQVGEAFKGARMKTVEQHLESLTSLGLLVRYEAGGTTRWHS